jgi:hypothetical protein
LPWPPNSSAQPSARSFSGIAQFGGGALLRGGDASAARGAKQRRGHAGARQSYDQHALAFEFDALDALP